MDEVDIFENDEHYNDDSCGSSQQATTRPAIRRGPIFRHQRSVQQSQPPRSVQSSPHIHPAYFIQGESKDITIDSNAAPNSLFAAADDPPSGTWRRHLTVNGIHFRRDLLRSQKRIIGELGALAIIGTLPVIATVVLFFGQERVVPRMLGGSRKQASIG